MTIFLLLGCILFAVGLVTLVFSMLCVNRYLDVKTSIRDIRRELKACFSITIGTRKSQQDAYAISPIQCGYIIKHNGLLAAVCDGMGGMQGGEIASRICADYILNDYIRNADLNFNPEELLKDAMLRANKTICTITDKTGQTLRSGTTSTAAIVKDGILHWVSVGDSRLYMYEGGRLQQITRDHNYYLELTRHVETQKITQQEADSNPHAEALISYIGMGDVRIMDSGTLDCNGEYDKVFVICSDGLYKALADIEIEEIITSELGNPQKIADRLIKAVESKRVIRQLDNTTVAVIGYGC